MADLSATFLRGRDGRFGPTPFRCGWFTAVKGGGAPGNPDAPSPISASAAFNPFSPRATGAASPASSSYTATHAFLEASATLRPAPLALAASPASSSPRAPFTPGRTLLDQRTDRGGLASFAALTDHLKRRPSPTH